MEDKRFLKVLIIVSILAILLTLSHCIYAYRAYENSSIIHLISQEIW